MTELADRNADIQPAARAWLDAFALPAFDADRPYMLPLDSDGVRKKTTREHSKHNTALRGTDLSFHGGDGQDVVLALFNKGSVQSEGSIGQLPCGGAELQETYSMLDTRGKDSDFLNTCNDSWSSLIKIVPQNELRGLTSGPGQVPPDVERATNRKIHALAQWEGILIKRLSVSDFTADASNDEKLVTGSSEARPTQPRTHWARPSASILPSLWLMSHGHASDHFSWNEDAMQFIARSINNIAPATPHSSLTALKSPEAEQTFSRTEDGRQLIPGLGNTVSRSLMHRFKGIGALQRRLWWRVADIRSGETSEGQPVNNADSPGELYSLAGGMSNILAWSVEELDRLSDVQSKGTLHAWATLNDLETVLCSLAEMLKCDLSRNPPFPPLLDTRTSSTSSSKKQSAHIISLVYGHLMAAVESGARRPLIATLRYLLDLVTSMWRKQIVNWIGWPCGEADQLPDEVETKMSIGREARRDTRQTWKPKDVNVDRCEPWAGIEVEWGWDERGELDVGYILRPVRLPAVLPIAQARDLLEAGRALRLLQRAAPEGHPLLTLRERIREKTMLWGTSRRSLDLPTWLWSESELALQDESVYQCIRDARREVAAWRRYKGRATKDLSASARQNQKIPLLARKEQMHDVKSSTTHFSRKAINQSLDCALATFDQAPDQVARENLSASSRGRKSSASLHTFIAQAKNDDVTATNVPLSTTTSLIAPMLQWSRLVNASLISVFFRDLHLGEYLDVCREFLLLGNQNFAGRIAEVLFDDGSKSTTVQVTDSLVSGIGLSNMLRGNTSWPPDGSELATTLNTAVLDSISYSRAQAALLKRGHSRIAAEPKASLGSETALLDLDDRLSFSVVSSTTAKGHVEWQDRQSIRALDWLTISFQPPPLIAPLITLQVQLSYQRLFRFLLHLMRVDAVLKGVFCQLMARPQPSCPDWMDSVDLERASRFRYEAHHFVAVIYRHATDVIIRQRWHAFRSRLNALRRSAESHDDGRQADEEAMDGASSAAPPSDSGLSVGFDAASDVDADGGGGATLMDDAVTDAGGVGASGADDPSVSRQFALKDVFSIAAYHERTLDRMLNGCFLKTRQLPIMTIMLNMFDIILAFGQLLHVPSAAVVAHQADDGGADWTEKSTSLGVLLTRFQSKMRLLLHALDLIGQRAVDRGSVLGSTPQRLRLSHDLPPLQHASTTSSSSADYLYRSSSSRGSRHSGNRSNATTSSARRHAAVDAEIARQEAETRRDLEELERNDRKGSIGDLEMIQALIAALQGR